MLNNEHLSNLRSPYRDEGLDESLLPDSAIQLLYDWIDEALLAERPPVVANALSLATVDEQGQPHCRIVLLKSVDANGLVFYTHQGSAKGQELAANPRAALAFHWPTLQRQLRVEGCVECVPPDEADEYFESRPLPTRLACWASDQSQVISGRSELESRLALAQQRFRDHEPTRPPDWGGYRLVPSSLEFWQGRPDRLHDRVRYRLSGGSWVRERLAP